MPAPSVPRFLTTNQIAHAVPPPTLARNARMGHPRVGVVRAKILKGGPPAKILGHKAKSMIAH